MDPIHLNYTHSLSSTVGEDHGASPEELAGLAPELQRAQQAIEARRTQDLRWLDLPYQSDVLQSLLRYAESVQGQFENVVVLGIGGSALGNRALHTALNSPLHELYPPPGVPRLFVLDNVDPDWIGEFLDRLDVTKCLFNVISKSGSTAETMSQFLIFRRLLIERLGEARHREHIVVTTDAKAGVLRPIVEQAGYTSFVVPDGVGGRFSVLSPVGLLSSALLGIDIGSLLAGAADMDQRCQSTSMEQNPAMTYAALQWIMQERKGKNIAVTFAYGHRLRDLADWYAQLLGESIGKRCTTKGPAHGVGPTPVRAVGVTDQHSQVQLYVEGPNDKWFTLLEIGTHDHKVPIPADFQDRDALAYLGGRDLGELFQAEREGTRIALSDANRPNCSIHFPRVNAHTLGQYLYWMEYSVALMGELYGIDAFDQPGVEAGKIAAYALMGRTGFGDRAKEIEARQQGPQSEV
ncbi:MAG TPA: glucose-6-phosphate isomerase [Planctomycetota bacterium]|nr:glucose-6-phosphate isomerase [Planctomycetota bacterium]